MNHLHNHLCVFAYTILHFINTKWPPHPSTYQNVYHPSKPSSSSTFFSRSISQRSDLLNSCCLWTVHWSSSQRGELYFWFYSVAVRSYISHLSISEPQFPHLLHGTPCTAHPRIEWWGLWIISLRWLLGAQLMFSNCFKGNDFAGACASGNGMNVWFSEIVFFQL